jgi:hypothetical protein
MQAWSFTYKTGVGFINSLASSALASQRFSLDLDDYRLTAFPKCQRIADDKTKPQDLR